MSRITLAAPMAGWLTSVRDVPDPVFSDEMMGVGIAIDPTEGTVVAPCAATVLLVAPTKHSVTLRTQEGVELLIHVGLETVALQGRGFQAHVRDGEQVAAGDLLISFDLDAVGLEAKSLVTPILVTNPDEFRFVPERADKLVARGEPIGLIEAFGSTVVATNQQGEMHRGEAEIGFEHGLHARPAAQIANCAKRFASEIAIAVGDRSASARSPTAIMALNVSKGDRVRVTATGEDAGSAIAAIVEILGGSEERQRTHTSAAVTRKLADNEIAGVCALPGVALGTAVWWRRQIANAAEEGMGIERERAALDEARAIVRGRLEALSSKSSGPASEIASAHIGLLDDEELNASAGAQIERGRSAARAWQIATAEAADLFRNSDNPRLRERGSDLDDIAAQVMAALLGDTAAPAVEFVDGTILVADDLLPSELMSLPRERIAGLAIAGGGPTSHVALIAASFGIPTLVAIGPELSRVPEGASVLLDAASGVLVIEPDDRAQRRARAQAEEVDLDTSDCITRDGERIVLLANLGGLSDVEAALAAGAEGCGLLRTEFLFLDRIDAPSQDEQRSAYQAIADGLGGRPLTIRTLDIGGDKPVPYIHFPKEQNPALGARGIRTGLFEPDLLDDQLRALAGLHGEAIKVMIPMVSSVAELRAVRERLSHFDDRVTLGVMIETPAAALIADRLAEEADFLSIGSNDLAQYALAMDRTNPLLAQSIDALHPAVLRLIAMTVDAGRAAGKSVSVCGNLASEPLGALVLIGCGIRVLSGFPAALRSVRRAIRQVSGADCKALAERALHMESAGEVRALAAELLSAAAQGEAQ